MITFVEIVKGNPGGSNNKNNNNKTTCYLMITQNVTEQKKKKKKNTEKEKEEILQQHIKRVNIHGMENTFEIIILMFSLQEGINSYDFFLYFLIGMFVFGVLESGRK